MFQRKHVSNTYTIKTNDWHVLIRKEKKKLIHFIFNVQKTNKIVRFLVIFFSGKKTNNFLESYLRINFVHEYLVTCNQNRQTLFHWNCKSLSIMSFVIFGLIYTKCNNCCDTTKNNKKRHRQLSTHTVRWTGVQYRFVAMTMISSKNKKKSLISHICWFWNEPYRAEWTITTMTFISSIFWKIKIDVEYA